MLVRAASVFQHWRCPVSVFVLPARSALRGFGLPLGFGSLLFDPQFLVAGLPAVGDLGQELADVFYILFSP
jgi:hypothetical protein